MHLTQNIVNVILDLVFTPANRRTNPFVNLQFLNVVQKPLLSGGNNVDYIKVLDNLLQDKRCILLVRIEGEA